LPALVLADEAEPLGQVAAAGVQVEEVMVCVVVEFVGVVFGTFRAEGSWAASSCLECPARMCVAAADVVVVVDEGVGHVEQVDGYIGKEDGGRVEN
jgi:hypothetical protein